MSRLTFNSGMVDIPAGTIYIDSNTQIVNEKGSSTKDVMSQRFVTDSLNSIESELSRLSVNKMNKAEAELTYLKIDDADNKYAPIADYALKSEIPDNLDRFATKDELPKNVGELINDAGYITEANLSNQFMTREEVESYFDYIAANREAWLHDYYTAEQIDRLLAGDSTDFNWLTKEAADMLYQPIGDYCTESYVDSKIAEIDIPEIDLSEYYTKSEIDTKISEIDVTDQLSDYATKQYVADEIAKIEIPEIPEIPEVDLSDYYTKSEIDEKIEDIDVSDQLANYVTNSDLDEVKETIISLSDNIGLIDEILDEILG